MKRSAVAIAGVAFVICGIGANTQAQVGKPLSAADQEAVERCVGHMLMGPQYNGISVGGQGFNCKPVGAITVSGGLYKISGQLSHQLTARPDDQINYTIQFTDAGEIKDVRIGYDRGGFGSLPGKVFSNVGAGRLLPDFLRGPTRGVIDRVYGGLGGDIRNWQRSAELMIGTVAVEVARSQANRNTPRSINYFLGRSGQEIINIEFTPNYLGQMADRGFVSKNSTIRQELDAGINLCTRQCNSQANPSVGTCFSWTLLRASNNHSPTCHLYSAGKPLVLNREAVSGDSAVR